MNGEAKLLENSKTSEPKYIHQRIILKNGKCNVNQTTPKHKKMAIFQFSKLVECSWPVTILIFLTTFLTSWFGFAVLYWLICYAHGDFEPNNLPEFQKQNNYTPCIYDITDFSSCFQFSMETQHTVGYGIKATNEECPEAIFVNAFQCIVGFIMQGFMAVIIFTKMTIPWLRAKTLLFSKYAVVALRNEQLCLMLRVGDTRKNHIVDPNIRAFFVTSTRTIEGEKIMHQQTELELQTDGCKKNLFFNWPLIVFHKITSKSPMYYYSPNNFKENKFEIIVVLEGTIESTGQMTQATTSYMPAEIVWGRKFESLMTFNPYRNEYEVNFSKFDHMLPVSTPQCSAAVMKDFNVSN